MKQFLQDQRQGALLSASVIVAFVAGAVGASLGWGVLLTFGLLAVVLAVAAGGAHGALRELADTYRRWWQLR